MMRITSSTIFSSCSLSLSLSLSHWYFLPCLIRSLMRKEDDDVLTGAGSSRARVPVQIRTKDPLLSLSLTLFLSLTNSLSCSLPLFDPNFLSISLLFLSQMTGHGPMNSTSRYQDVIRLVTVFDAIILSSLSLSFSFSLLFPHSLRRRREKGRKREERKGRESCRQKRRECFTNVFYNIFQVADDHHHVQAKGFASVHDCWLFVAFSSSLSSLSTLFSKSMLSLSLSNLREGKTD